MGCGPTRGRSGANLDTWRQGVRGLRQGLAAALAVLAAACGSAPPVAPQMVAMEEDRLLRPFATKRTVIADTVEVVLTPNFLGNRLDDDFAIERFTPLTGVRPRVGWPGIDKKLHEKREEKVADGVLETFINRGGGVERPIRVVIGETQYQALRALSFKVLHGNPAMTLDVIASGDVTVVAGAQRTDSPRIEVRDGVWRGE